MYSDNRVEVFYCELRHSYLSGFLLSFSLLALYSSHQIEDVLLLQENIKFQALLYTTFLIFYLGKFSSF